MVGIVGESGSGKSVTALALLGLIDAPGRVRAERLAFDGRELRSLSPRERRSLLGGDIAMIFQDPMTSLNPSFSVAFQLMETIGLHEGGSRAARRARALELLRAVEIPDAERRLDAFPHQLSGGMSQRVMLAMAIACNPRLLIADEPTTALDVTIQAQMLALLLRLQRERGMALVLITHDLGVVTEVAERVIVMYAGQVVEEAAVPRIFERRAIPTPRRCSPPCPSATPAGAGCSRWAVSFPAPSIGPAAACSRRAAPTRRSVAGPSGRTCSSSSASRARCFFPLPGRAEVGRRP